MNFGHLVLASMVLTAIFMCGASHAQTGVPAEPERIAPGAVDCGKSANKALPACTKDKGINLPPPVAIDPEIKREPPATGDPIANPSAGEDKKTPR
jgi:hypothetical protein